MSKKRTSHNKPESREFVSRKDDESSTSRILPNLQDVFLKEYELCFGRAESIYELMNNVIQLFTTVFFAIISVFGFASTDTYGGIFGDSKILPVSLLLGLVIYGVATLFMHIATWGARNEYRKRKSKMRTLLFGLYDEKSVKEELIKYLTIPRYVNSGVLRSLSLCMWYYLYIFLCNWIAMILLSSVAFGIGSRNFIIAISVFPFIQWIASEIYIKLKQRSHLRKSIEKYRKYSKCSDFRFYSKLMDELFDSSKEKSNL